MKQKKPLGIYLCYILRHSPESINLKMDELGWVNIEDLINQSKTKRLFNYQDLLHEVENDNKKRYQISEDGLKIRCVQGHSVSNVFPDLIEFIPDSVLYHGTATRFLSSIEKEGLKPMSRILVHLTTDKEVAIQTGRRHGEPVILVINTERLNAISHVFYRAHNGVVLTSHIPSEYITRDT